MFYLVCLIIGFAVVQLVVTLTNLIFRQSWRSTDLVEKPCVSVLIPARNEEGNIGNLLSDLLLQDYPNLEILVFNDQSTDTTANIIDDFSSRHTIIKRFDSIGLPKGWLGKNFACHSLSVQARGRYYLFLDADVRLRPQAITKAVAILQRQKVALLSVFPVQEMRSAGERMTVPVMNFILLSLLPLILVRRSRFATLAAANGQFMMFDAHAYQALLPHEKLKASKVEDIEIARLLKRRRFSVACVMGSGDICCRMYHSYNEAIMGFAKNVRSFFGGSWLVTILFWLVTTLGFVPVLIHGNMLLIVCYLAALVVTRMIVSILSFQSIVNNLIYLIPQQWALGAFIIRALKNSFTKTEIWKGRNIS